MGGGVKRKQMKNNEKNEWNILGLIKEYKRKMRIILT